MGTGVVGNGYMLLGLAVDALAARYRDDSATRDGTMMLLAAPTQFDPGSGSACATYGASVLILPDALLYATVAIVDTHAAVWTVR